MNTALTTIARAPRASCPQCGGYPEFDDEGGQYACYFCCNEGTVEASIAEAFYRAEQDMAEQFAPVRLGIFVRPMANEWDWDEPDAPPAAAGHRLFSRLIPVPRFVRTAPVFLPDDDLPF